MDVEQILGRVLRLPDTKKNPNNILNLSYVITCSANFYQTLDKVVAGLNSAGFSSRDCRARDVEPEAPVLPTVDPGEQLVIQPPAAEEPEDFPEIDVEKLRQKISVAVQPENLTEEPHREVEDMLRTALDQNDA